MDAALHDPIAAPSNLRHPYTMPHPPALDAVGVAIAGHAISQAIIGYSIAWPRQSPSPPGYAASSNPWRCWCCHCMPHDQPGKYQMQLCDKHTHSDLRHPRPLATQHPPVLGMVGVAIARHTRSARQSSEAILHCTDDKHLFQSCSRLRDVQMAFTNSIKGRRKGQGGSVTCK